MRNIIIVGDSFTYGHGCSDRTYYFDRNTKSWVGNSCTFISGPSEYCWASLLQKHYPQLNVVNLSKPGNCNQSMFRNITQYYRENTISSDDLIIFSGTFSDRIEVSSESTTIPPSVPIPWCLAQDPASETETAPDYRLAKKLYITYLYNDEIGINLTLSALLAAYGYSIAGNANFLWSLAIMDTPEDWETFPGTFNGNIWDTVPEALKQSNLTFITNFDFSGVYDLEFNKSCRSSDHHVNDKGHAIYFEKQILPMIEGLLNKV